MAGFDVAGGGPERDGPAVSDPGDRERYQKQGPGGVLGRIGYLVALLIPSILITFWGGKGGGGGGVRVRPASTLVRAFRLIFVCVLIGWVQHYRRSPIFFSYFFFFIRVSVLILRWVLVKFTLVTRGFLLSTEENDKRNERRVLCRESNPQTSKCVSRQAHVQYMTILDG